MIIGAMAVSIFGIVTIGPSQVVNAHFDVEDTATGIKASFHATPDHSPVAGSNSVISFDFGKAGYETKGFTYVLTVNKTRENKVIIPTTTISNVVIADYKFPTQGLYTVTLIATPKVKTQKPTVLTYNQRVSRGEVAKNSKFGNFEIGVLVVVLAAVGIVFTITFRNSIMKTKKGRGI